MELVLPWPHWPPCNAGVQLSQGLHCSPNWGILPDISMAHSLTSFLCLCSMKLLLTLFLKVATEPDLPLHPLWSLPCLLILISFLNVFYFLLVYYELFKYFLLFAFQSQNLSPMRARMLVLQTKVPRSVPGTSWSTRNIC